MLLMFSDIDHCRQQRVLQPGPGQDKIFEHMRVATHKPGEI